MGSSPVHGPRDACLPPVLTQAAEKGVKAPLGSGSSNSSSPSPQHPDSRSGGSRHERAEKNHPTVAFPGLDSWVHDRTPQ